MFQPRTKTKLLTCLTLVALLTSSAAVVLPSTYATTPLVSQRQGSRNYIGLRYRTLPGNLQGLGGWTIGSPFSSPEYSVSHVQQGKKQMLWLELILSRDNAGKPLFEVKDVLNLPSLKSTEQLASVGCLVNGKRDPEVIAIAVLEDTEYWGKIRRAWRANRRTTRFEEISPRNIACENPGWGV